MTSDTDDGSKLKFDLPMKTRASLATVLTNIYTVADSIHDPDDHMGDSICKGCYINNELKQIRKYFNVAMEAEELKKNRGKNK